MIRGAGIILLTLAAAGTWLLSLTSAWRPLSWEIGAGHNDVVALAASGGHIGAFWIRTVDRSAGEPPGFYASRARVLYPTVTSNARIPWNVRSNWGFGVGGFVTRTPWGGTYRCTEFTAPLWAPYILFATYPTIVFIRGPLCRWRRLRNGVCVECGYDLTGNVSGVCSECGVRFDPSILPYGIGVDCEES